MSATRPEQLYDTDFYAWTQAQAKELRRLARTRPNVPLDLAHIAEEIRDLGKSEYDAAFGLVQQILQHLLLIEHSPAIDQRLDWADEIDEFRDRLERKLSPTIRRRLKREFADAFARARRRVQPASRPRPRRAYRDSPRAVRRPPASRRNAPSCAAPGLTALRLNHKSATGSLHTNRMGATEGGPRLCAIAAPRYIRLRAAVQGGLA